jgi:uncharacterized protein (TIGR02246 family)
MKRFAAICTATALALIITACSQPDTHDADVKAIQDNEAQWNRDYASKDLTKIVAHYADNAVVMAPGMPSSSGRDAIRSLLQKMTADPALSLQFKASSVEVAKSGDIGYTQGTYTMTMTDPATKQVVHDHGSYVTTYRKQADGTWKAVTDIASSEVPTPTPPPAPANKKSKSKSESKSHAKSQSKGTRRSGNAPI